MFLKIVSKRVVDEVPPSKLGFKAAASLARARAKAVEGFREAGCTVDDIVVGIDFIYISYLFDNSYNFVISSTVDDIVVGIYFVSSKQHLFSY